MYENLLRNIGLTENEVKVYLSLMKIGLSTSSRIVKQAGVSSGKIYETMDKLYQKGLVSITKINGVQHFQTTHPQAIISFVHEQKKDLDQKEDQLAKILPKIIELQKTTGEPFSANVMIGIRSIKPVVIEVMSKAKETILAMGIRGSKKEKYNNFWWHNINYLINKHNKKMRFLFSENTSAYYKKFLTLKNTEIKYLKSITPVAIDTIDDHVMIFTYEEDLQCVHIQSRAIATSFRAFFEGLWQQAESEEK